MSANIVHGGFMKFNTSYILKIFASFLLITNCFTSKADDAESCEDRLMQMQIDEQQYKIPEIILGNKNAKYALIVYSSFTCDHCRQFHQKELKNFIEQYVDTGKVKLILRYYVDDGASFDASVFVIYFSKGDHKLAFYLMEKIFDQQKNWRKAKDQPMFIKKLIATEMHKIHPNVSIEEYIQQAEKILDMLQEPGKSIGASLMLSLQQTEKMRITSMPCMIFTDKINSQKPLTKEQHHEGSLSPNKIWEKLIKVR